MRNELAFVTSDGVLEYSIPGCSEERSGRRMIEMEEMH